MRPAGSTALKLMTVDERFFVPPAGRSRQAVRRAAMAYHVLGSVAPDLGAGKYPMNSKRSAELGLRSKGRRGVRVMAADRNKVRLFSWRGTLDG